MQVMHKLMFCDLHLCSHTLATDGLSHLAGVYTCMDAEAEQALSSWGVDLQSRGEAYAFKLKYRQVAIALYVQRCYIINAIL